MSTVIFAKMHQRNIFCLKTCFGNMFLIEISMNVGTKTFSVKVGGDLCSRMKIVSQLKTSLQLQPSAAAGAPRPLSSQFAFFHTFTLATCLPGVTQLSRFDGCATLLRIPISRVFVKPGPGPSQCTSQNSRIHIALRYSKISLYRAT